MGYREAIPQQKPTEPVDTQPLLQVPVENLFTLLQTQIKNYPAMFAFYRKHIYIPSVIFVPQTLKLLDGELTRNSTFLYETLSFMDTVGMFSFQETGNSMYCLDSIIEYIAESRTVTDEKMVLNGSGMSNVIYRTKEDVYNLLRNNRNIAALYLFCMVCHVFFIKEL